MIEKAKPRIIDLCDSGGNKLGTVEELTSGLNIKETSLARVRLDQPDAIHHHMKGAEIYICEKGEGELFLEDEIIPFNEGDVIRILPGLFHAARPQKPGTLLTFLCLSIPAFDPLDVWPVANEDFSWWYDYKTKEEDI